MSTGNLNIDYDSGNWFAEATFNIKELVSNGSREYTLTNITAVMAGQIYAEFDGILKALVVTTQPALALD